LIDCLNVMCLRKDCLLVMEKCECERKSYPERQLYL
jgi:hypothetical protein